MKNALEWLENSAEKYPYKIAYESNDKKYTFSEVMLYAQKIGSQIIKRNADNTPIATILDRNVDTILDYLGIVYSGHAYAPIDANLPDARIEVILHLLKPQLIITNNKNREKVEDILTKVKLNSSVLIEDELRKGEIDSLSINNIRKNMCSTDPLYVIFTSGSSGRPKGVITSHMTLINYIQAYADVMEINEHDRLGNQSPLDYIAAIRDIYLPIYKSAYTFILPKEFFMQPVKLTDIMNEKKITCIGWSASALAVLTKLGIFKECQLHYLKKICFSGSIIPNNVIMDWQKHLPKTCMVNQYGPTEATASCTYYIIDHTITEHEVLPIGRPYDNYRVFLLKNDGTEAGYGELGEICVGGPVLALGYYGDAERTQASFVQNPLQKMYDDRIYRTGDIGRYNSEGLLEFHGRKDRQIKHLGHRIELDEIECEALKIADVSEAATVYASDTDTVYLYYTGQITVRDIVIDLRKRLPGFMVPRKVICLNDIPKLPNGKIDINKLKQLSKEN